MEPNKKKFSHDAEKIRNKGINKIKKGCRAMILCILFVFSCYSGATAEFKGFTESL